MAQDGIARRATPPLLKRLNERAVLEAIRGGAPISRAEIARRTGISKPTVSLALRALVDGGVVRETAPDPGRPHYGAVFFEPVPEAALVLALDIGTRFIRGALGDLVGNVRARHDVHLPGSETASPLDAVVALCDALITTAGAPAERIDSAVVGVPGVVAPTDSSVSLATNVPGIEGAEFAAGLRASLPMPVRLENDVNLAALGEQWRGVARGVEDFLFLSVGTGMGAGLVLRGELHRGRNGAAGELDYAFVGLGPNVDPSAPAVSELTGELARRRDGTTLLPPYEPREIFAAARAGDVLARDVVREEARRIALHVMPVAAVADVELVVLGGGLGTNADLLLGPIRDHLAEHLPYPPRVEVSALGEAAVLTGALATGVWTARENVLAQKPA
jgi:predicted NBD/HSP70 family sugar kinase